MIRNACAGRAVSHIALACALLGSVTPALAQQPAPAPAPPPAPAAPTTPVEPTDAGPSAPVDGPRTYTPQDFARFAPQNALDMLRQVPGFTIRNAQQERGLGEATANVLLNGQRISGKSDDVGTQLSRVSARNVVRIEIRDGATLSVSGLSGQVANIITRATGITGQYSWNPEIRAHNTNPVLTRFSSSLSGTMGPVEYTLGLENQAGEGGADGPTYILNAKREYIEFREDQFRSPGQQPRISGRFVYDGPGSSVGNLNLSYRYFDYAYRETGLRRGPGQVDRERSVTSDTEGYEYEIGGDFEFAVGPGRLKLIALNQFEHEPNVQTVITDFANSSPSVGSRFARIGDESERIARAEYRWRGGGGDWQISAEGAFNSLDNISQLFTLQPDGEFREIPLPNGSARVEEDRYEVIGSYGRPLASNLTMQLSAGGEYSQLRQIGAVGLTRTFYRPKGALSLAWKPEPRLDVNLRVQRRVGQLNFFDFLQSVNLNEDRENAGNPDLVPPQSWEIDLEGIRRLGAYGTTALRLYTRLIDDIVDIVPIGATGESPGNIDRATVYGAEWKTTFNFDPMGWRGAKLDARFQVQDTSVADPLTGEQRRISSSLVHLAELGLRHDIPDSNWAWGSNLNYVRSARYFRLTEVGRQYEGPVFANLYVENKDVMGLTVRATWGNALNGRSYFDRTVFAGRRTDPVAFFERRDRRIGPIFSFSVRGRF